MTTQAQPEGLEEKVAAAFGEYGPEGCQIIYQELERRGSISAVLAQLGLPDPGYTDDQMTVLLNFVRRSGVDGYQRALDPRQRGRIPSVSRYDRFGPDPITSDEEINTSRVVLPRAEQTRRHVDPNWPGPERRSGIDRRQGDRRNLHQNVFHNMRHASDRRGGERRKNWPPKQN